MCMQVTPRKKDQDPAHRMNQLEMGLGLQENILHGGWVYARSESHYCTREPLPGPEHARNEDLLLQ